MSIQISWQAAYYLMGTLLMGTMKDIRLPLWWQHAKEKSTSEYLLPTGAKLIIKTGKICAKRADRPRQEFFVSGYSYDGSDVKPYEKYDIARRVKASKLPENK